MTFHEILEKAREKELEALKKQNDQLKQILTRTDNQINDYKKRIQKVREINKI